MNFYYQKDCNLALIQQKKVAVIGFGSQGRAHAQNLKDNGIEVIIGLYPESKSITIAKSLGFEVYNVSQCVQKSDLIVMMIPDELHQEIFERDIKPFLQSHHTLVFCHGFSVHFKLVLPPENIGVIMVAPKAQGKGVRDGFLKDNGVPALIAVHQENQENNAKDLALSYAAAIKADKSFIMEATFKLEAESDLFGEQAVLCGGLKALVKNAFEVLVESGFPKELAYFECLHELKLVVDLLYQGGLESLHKNISNTAEYGMIISQDHIVPQTTKQAMQELLRQIQNGSFAKDFVLEKQSGYLRMQAERKNIHDHPIEQIGRDLRQKIFKNKS